MKCKNCGTAIRDGASFCSECGCSEFTTDQSIPKNTVVCPACGNAVLSDITFCSVCGHVMAHIEQPPTPAVVTESQPKRSKRPLIALIIVIALICVTVIGIVCYKMISGNKNSSQKDTNTVVTTDNTDDTTETTDEVSAYQELIDYVEENGTRDNSGYAIYSTFGEAVVSISVSDDNISFNELLDKTYVYMNLEEDSKKQTVYIILLDEDGEFSDGASGVIDIPHFDYQNEPDIYDISRFETTFNDEDSSRKYLLTGIEALLLSVDSMLTESPVSMEDLGFKNYN